MGRLDDQSMGVACKSIKASCLSHLLPQDLDFQPKFVATIDSGTDVSSCLYSGGWMILRWTLSLETSMFNQAPIAERY